MARLPTRVNRADPEFAQRKAHNTALINELRARLETCSQGGGGKYVERHRSRGKHLARERISGAHGDHVVVEAGAAAFKRHTQCFEFFLQPADTHTQHESSVGDEIEARRLFCHI